MIGIIGRKLGMTQVFNEDGQQIPCTVVEATPKAVIRTLTATPSTVVPAPLAPAQIRRVSSRGRRCLVTTARRVTPRLISASSASTRLAIFYTSAAPLQVRPTGSCL